MSTNNYQPLVLVIDDEPQILRLLSLTLTAANYRVITAETGKSGILETATKKPDVVILDLGLPDIEGSEVVKQIREWTKTPIIILSVRDDSSDKINALDRGADDYLTKPFDIEELLARIRAVSRRLQGVDDTPLFEISGLRIDFSTRQVFVDNEELHLTPTEYSILRALIQSRGKIITQSMLLRQVWGPQAESHTEYLRVHITHLRKKLGEKIGQRIKTDSGIGYRFE